MCGSALRQEDFLFDEVEPMETKISGICCKCNLDSNDFLFRSLVFAVNNGSEKVEQVRDAGWVSKYLINGVLGEVTFKQELDSKVTIKTDYG